MQMQVQIPDRRPPSRSQARTAPQQAAPHTARPPAPSGPVPPHHHRRRRTCSGPGPARRSPLAPALPPAEEQDVAIHSQAGRERGRSRRRSERPALPPLHRPSQGSASASRRCGGQGAPLPFPFPSAAAGGRPWPVTLKRPR